MSTPLVDETFRDLVTALRAQADPSREADVRHFFNEPIETYGLPVPSMRAITREFLPRLKKEGSLNEMLDLCERLLQTNHLEECLAVETLMAPFVKKLQPEDWDTLDRWVDYLSNWAVTDGVSGHIIGPLLERHPELSERMLLWTGSSNRWRRRSACVSLCGLARHGLIEPQTVFAITNNVMSDTDDMVQKGTGWVLKEMASHHEDAVVEYLLRYPKAGRTMVRYAIERCPQRNERCS